MSTNPGIWISKDRILKLTPSGPAWEQMRAVADAPMEAPNLSNQEEDVNVRVLAKALVGVRRGQNRLYKQVQEACMAVIGTEQGGRTLALGRKLAAYVIAADLVGLTAKQNAKFRTWLSSVLVEELEGKTLISTNEYRPNNWGTAAGATIAAIAVYLGDKGLLDRTALVFKGWLGDRTAYASFKYGDLWWQSDPAQPVGINPVGARIGGHLVEGVQPEEMRRSGPFVWPPPKENYCYTALQGALVQAVILNRAGYDVWNWQDEALLRALGWLYTIADFQASGDDEGIPYIINYFYGRNYPHVSPAHKGKIVAWTDWTHSGAAQ